MPVPHHVTALPRERSEPRPGASKGLVEQGPCRRRNSLPPLSVKTAVEALRDKKAEDVTVIDITGVSSIADYFIIANGNNQNQLTAMQDAVDEALYKAGRHAKQIEGNNKSTWILMDYEDIIVHLFSKVDRLFYDLERIWRDGKIIEM